jgi:SHS2 domain-containing protein
MDFQIIEHTADVGIRARGANQKEAFAAAALGLFSLITEPGGVKGEICREVEVSGSDEEGLLVAWLNELIFLFEVERLLLSRFEIIELFQQRLKALVYGERIDPSRHTIKLGVKAATYHMLSVDKKDGYEVQVLFDI